MEIIYNVIQKEFSLLFKIGSKYSEIRKNTFTHIKLFININMVIYGNP